MILRTPTEKEFLAIRNYIQQFELDNRMLASQEFIAAFRDGELVGFGRLRKHDDGIELCSLGVVAKHRQQGIGKAIVNALLKQTNESIHLVCIIPEFFIPLGFQIVENYPQRIQEKRIYCTQELIVAEAYVVMCLKR
jgi:N-acetylglutamate synthase-like GNAT family acetyltransferase